MSTPDRSAPTLPSTPSIPSAEPPRPPETLSGPESAGALAREIERLANQFFFGVPGPVLNVASPVAALPAQAPAPVTPPRMAPSALSPGAGGASPGVSLPPAVGWAQAQPPASAPPPRESDFRAVPTLLADQLGLASPLVLVSVPDAAASTPYFLGLAGLPAPTTAAALPGYAPPAGPNAPAAALADPPVVPTSGVPSTGVPAPGVPAWGAPPSDLPTSGMPAWSVPTSGMPAWSVPTSGMTTPGVPTSGVPAWSAPMSDLPVSGVPSTGVPTSDLPTSGVPTPGVPTSGARSSTTGPDLGATDFQPQLVPELASPSRQFEPNTVKKDFPILRERVNGRPLVWLDNAATTQKPQVVIDRIKYFYEHENSNVHRAAHTLAARATDAYEGARDKVRRFLNAPSAKEIVFVRGATEAINLVAQSWGRRNVGPGDEIVITWLEHHANIVPWQQLCAEKGARLRVVPVDDRGEVLLDEYDKLLGPRTRIVSITQVSNALGTILPVRDMVQTAHRHGARVLVDGAQAVSHMPVDVQALDCDFYVFSGHKIFAPTGIGVLFGKADVLDTMPPWQGGGNMIADVTFEKTTYQPPPLRFEAGTGSIADAVGLGAALDYIRAIGLENVSRYEHELRVYAEERLARVPGLHLIGCAPEKAGVMSFVLDGQRTEDVGRALDQEGIAVRSGHHCAQPSLRRFGLEATVRASLAPYNTREDIDALVDALSRLQVGRPS
jgi:cysteine desulfurase/selenocysteine lyase